MVDTEDKILFEGYVHSEWVDYNGHMSDADYARVFSMAVDAFIEKLGADASFRTQNSYAFFTLETHLCYLAEIREGQFFQVTVHLLNYDTKRLHVFFTMENKKNIRLATSEQLLIGMDMKVRKPSPFSFSIKQKVINFSNTNKIKPIPAEVGRIIGIPNRSQ